MRPTVQRCFGIDHKLGGNAQIPQGNARVGIKLRLWVLQEPRPDDGRANTSASAHLQDEYTASTLEAGLERRQSPRRPSQTLHPAPQPVRKFHRFFFTDSLTRQATGFLGQAR